MVRRIDQPLIPRQTTLPVITPSHKPPGRHSNTVGIDIGPVERPPT